MAMGITPMQATTIPKTSFSNSKTKLIPVPKIKTPITPSIKATIVAPFLTIEFSLLRRINLSSFLFSF